jgi:hypothetical protein
LIRIITPIIAGLVYGFVAASLWSLYSKISPVDGWLIEAIASEGYDRLYGLADLMHGSLVHVVFAVPIVFLLARARLLTGWIGVGAASVAAFIASSVGPDWTSTLAEGVGFWLDAASVAIGPVLAFAAIRALRPANGRLSPVVQ